MFPQVVRLNDYSRDATLTYTNVSTASNGEPVIGVPTVLRWKGALGGINAAGFNRTKNYVPGQFSINPFSVVRKECSCTGITNRKLYIPWYGKLLLVRILDGDLPLWASPPISTMLPVTLPNIPTTVNSNLIIRAGAKSKAADLLVAVTAKELPETLGLLHSPFSKLPRALRKLAPKAGRKGRKALDFAASAWLTYRYGIMPLISEVDTIREMVNEKLDLYTGIKQHRARDVVPVSLSETTFDRNLSFCKVRGGQSVRRETRLMATAYTSGWLTGAYRLGLNAGSILPSIYEMIPYSFVVDWFLDVGTWLSYISPQSAVRDLGATYSEATINTAELNITNVSPDGQLWFGSGGSIKYSDTSYARTTTPLRGYYPKLTNAALTLKQAIDSVTLSYQRVKPYMIMR